MLDQRKEADSVAFDLKAIEAVYRRRGVRYSLSPKGDIIGFPAGTETLSRVDIYVHMAREDIVEVLTAAPIAVPEARFGEVCLYLMHVSSELRAGTFKLNLDDGSLYYQVGNLIDTGHGLDDQAVAWLSLLGLHMMDRYLPGVLAILYGGSTAAQAFDKIRQDKD